MKRIIFMLILFVIAAGAIAQELPPPREIPKEYRSEYRRIKSDVLKETKQLERKWDIVIDPIEAVPVMQYDATNLEQSNWGERILLPDDLRQRLVDECSHPVIVKIYDTAGDYDHPDLQTGKLPGTNYTTDENLTDVHGHSTHVSGIVAARGFGVLYDLIDAGLIEFKAVKVLNNSGSGSFSWIGNAIRTERTEDVDYLDAGIAVVANFSLGGGTTTIPTVETELQASTEAGVIFVCAAGNSGGSVIYPGLSPLTVAVSSLDENMTISSFSSRGPELDHAMPGRAILSTYKNGGYAELSGTSMASPFQTSAAAIAISKWGLSRLPTPDALREYLASVATELGPRNQYGYGINYIIAILDTEPGDVPPPPPPPDDPDEPRERQQRDVVIPLYDYVMFWQEQGGTSDLAAWLRPDAADVVNLEDDPAFIADLQSIAVKSVVVRLDKCKLDADYAYDLLSAAVNEYFVNRGIVIPAPADFRDAANWTAYFLEMLVGRELDMKITVEEITADDGQKRRVVIGERDLTHWRGN